MKNDKHIQRQDASQVRPVSYSRSSRRKGARVQSVAFGQEPLNSSKSAPNVSTYSRATYAREFSKPKKHRTGLIALVVAMALALVVGGVAFAGFMYMNSVSEKLTENVDENVMASLSTEDRAPEDPFYVLLLGVDRSEARQNSDQYAGDTFRSDSMMLARVDPQQKIVTLVSIERDTYVEIEGYGPNKINASAAYGGAPLVIDTIEDFAGVPISHYVEIDFDGFKAAVDALGGIEVDVPLTIDDDNAGGHVDAGLQTLDGDQALILCRSRHAYDEYGGGDYYRMANQRMVIGAIAKKVLASDPMTMANTVNAMADYITTDMDMATIISIATQMKGMDVENDIYSAHNPTISSYDGTVWLEYCDLDAWREMMTRVDQGLPPYEDDKRNKNDGGGLDGTVMGEQEYIPEGSGAEADGWTNPGEAEASTTE